MNYEKSKELLKRALEVTPLAAQTYSKSYRYYPLGNAPSFIEKGEGCYLYDVDGNKFIDFVCALGPITIGYNDKSVNEAVINQLNKGICFSLQGEVEVILAEKLIDIVPCAEMVRFVKNGSDATTAAIRLSRAYTGRDLVALCGYHGMHDWSIGATENNRGIPEDISNLTKKFEYNDIDSVKKLFEDYPNQIAAIILEPIQANGPKEGFLEELRELTEDNGTILIFDEVVTGFRIGLSGAQGYFGVDPDLTVFGKVIAGGYPGAGGIGGHRDCMQHLGAGLDSSGKKVKKALCGGTMAATPISCCAGYYTLEEIERTNACEKAGRLADRLTEGIRASVERHGLPFVVFNQGSICHVDTVGTMHFAVDWSKPWTLPKVLKETSRRQIEMEHIGAAYMAEGIITLAGSRLYTSAAYDEEMIDDVISRFDRVFSKCGKLED